MKRLLNASPPPPPPLVGLNLCDCRLLRPLADQQVAMLNARQYGAAGCEFQKPADGFLRQRSFLRLRPGASPYVQPPPRSAYQSGSSTLTRKNAPLGKAMLNAAQMAVFDMSSDNLFLLRDLPVRPMQALRPLRGMRLAAAHSF